VPYYWRSLCLYGGTKFNANSAAELLQSAGDDFFSKACSKYNLHTQIKLG